MKKTKTPPIDSDQKIWDEATSYEERGIKSFSVDMDLENGEELRDVKCSKALEPALKKYNELKVKKTHRGQKIKETRIVVNFYDGDWEYLDSVDNNEEEE